jgi:hypothetical protein
MGTDRSLFECRGCTRVFQRQDARLKHTRKQHPELCPLPVRRRQSTAQDSRTSSSDDNVHGAHDLDYLGQWSQPNSILAGNFMHEPEDEGTSVAQYVVTALEASLHPTDFLRGCDSFFTRWESIVQHLREKRPDAYPVYSKALEDICAIVHANNIAHTTCSSSHRSTSETNTEQRHVPRDNRNLGPGYESNRINKSGERKSSSTPGSGKNTRVALGAKSNPGRRTEVDCPVFKHHIMQNTVPPCRGCRVGVMAQVRSHLNPSRTGIHGGFPAFIQQCSRCKQDFIERQLYEDHLTASACVSQNQTRGDIAIPWARQYLALYPNARRVPLPWPNERGWLPNSVFTQCRAPVADSTVARPFLGEHRSRHDPQPQIPAQTMNNSTESPEYRAALGHMLHDFVAPTYTQPTRSSTPVLNYERPTAAELGSPFDGSVGNSNPHWLNVLQSFGTHQRTIRQAAAYLTPQQLQYVAVVSDQISDISHAMCQHHQPQAQPHPHPHPQPAPIQILATTAYDDTSTQGSTTAYGTPIQPEYWHTFINPQLTPSIPGSTDEVATPSTNTLTSNASYGAMSSQRPNSLLTDPSSVHVPSNHGFLSPYSPYDNRRTSLPADVLENGPRSHQAVPGPRSLPDNPGGYIDPMLLSDDNVEHDEWLNYDNNDLH